MMGNKTLSALREELRAALAEEGSDLIASLDRKIRKLEKSSKSAEQEFRSLPLLRNALAQLVEVKPQKRLRSPRSQRPKKAI